MTHTTAHELRAAATKLRRLASAEGLEPGPWLVHNRGGYPEAVYSEGSDVVLAECTDDIDSPKPHASYIAAMHPAVGQALAAWLDAEARRLDVAAPGWKDAADPHALVVARAITGGQP